MTRPNLTLAKNENETFIELREARHPCLSQAGVNFIPNDVCIGNWKNE